METIQASAQLTIVGNREFTENNRVIRLTSGGLDLNNFTKLTLTGTGLDFTKYGLFFTVRSDNLPNSDTFAVTVSDVDTGRIVLNIKRVDRNENPGATFFIDILVVS